MLKQNAVPSEKHARCLCHPSEFPCFWAILPVFSWGAGGRVAILHGRIRRTATTWGRAVPPYSHRIFGGFRDFYGFSGRFPPCVQSPCHLGFSEDGHPGLNVYWPTRKMCVRCRIQTFFYHTASDSVILWKFPLSWKFPNTIRGRIVNFQISKMSKVNFLAGLAGNILWIFWAIQWMFMLTIRNVTYTYGPYPVDLISNPVQGGDLTRSYPARPPPEVAPCHLISTSYLEVLGILGLLRAFSTSYAIAVPPGTFGRWPP